MKASIVGHLLTPPGYHSGRELAIRLQHCKDPQYQGCAASRESVPIASIRNIPQVTSWSKLKITFPMFARVCHSLRLMPPFLELVSTFGYRRENSDNYFSAGFRRSFRSMDSFRPSYSHGMFLSLFRVIWP